MEYLELTAPAPAADIAEMLVYRLSEAGFDSFAEEAGEFRAYIPVHSYRVEETAAIFAEHGVRFSVRPLPDQNWNHEWEKNFPPVMIAGKCFIRAPFHESDPAAELEVIIEPKMSFGTAHHETTAMMVEAMLENGFRDMQVLDMGCGTGILAIIAGKLGAAEILAIDNDRWAYENCLENCQRNLMGKIRVLMGGKEAIQGRFDRILANINRNILLDQIPEYAESLEKGGLLFMSGFYLEDLPSIRFAAEQCKLAYREHRSRNDWVAVTFEK